MRSLLLLAVLGLTPHFAWADDSDGNQLLKSCNAVVQGLESSFDPKLLENAAFCLGLMQGVVNTNQIYMQLVDKKALFCTPPSGINNGQSARIVTKYLKEHPEDLHENMTLLVVMALRDAYPCA